MAQLTLSERSAMSVEQSFLVRMSTAIKKTANYWKEHSFVVFADYNVATQKRKQFASRVLNSGIDPITLQAYAAFFLSVYNEDPPALITDPNDPLKGQLTDAALVDSFASANSYDYFAGVKAGDDTRQIDF